MVGDKEDWEALREAGLCDEAESSGESWGESSGGV